MSSFFTTGRTSLCLAALLLMLLLKSDINAAETISGIVGFVVAAPFLISLSMVFGKSADFLTQPIEIACVIGVFLGTAWIMSMPIYVLLKLFKFGERSIK